MYSDADSSFQESNTSRNSTLTGRRAGPGVSIAQSLLRPARNRAPRTASGTGVTTPLLRRPPSTPAGPRYAKSFATLAKEDLDRAEVFGIIHRSGLRKTSSAGENTWLMDNDSLLGHQYAETSR